MTTMIGGATVYGSPHGTGPPVGFLMLETQFPRLRGDVGNHATWDFPALYSVVAGAGPKDVIGVEPETELVEAFLASGRALVDEGAVLVGTRCGYLSAIQSLLAHELAVPVVSSALIQVPLVASMVGRRSAIGILTQRPHLNAAHFTAAGWDPNDFDVRIGGFRENSDFPKVFIDGDSHADPDRLEEEICLAVDDLITDHPDIRAFVFECTNFAPFSAAVRQHCGLPVFDYVTAVTAAYNAIVGPTFPRRL
ncbi:aspartate/glutamate racemase family protein [Brevibacterium ammoniilyticum]|uniref:Aspartate/glutamate racemase family protein n=1 Tax=Brevibacterium ammoniilyticum TaxID=1046555 RepID=A0ABP9TVG5_9MICO